MVTSVDSLRCPYCLQENETDYNYPIDGDTGLQRHVCVLCGKTFEYEEKVKIVFYSFPLELIELKD
jgi:transposase-like protein